jgi:transcriptional regulator with AAA-type ATPase domain
MLSMNIDIFRQMESAAFTNPFSDERVEIDREIVGAPEGASWDDMQEPLFQTLEKSIQGLENMKGLVVARESDADARAVAVSVLFYVFYQVQDQFDALIEEQIAAGETLCKAPFAFQCLEKLAGYGFPRSEACRYIGIFYQIRRAYYFISKGLVGDSSCVKKLRAQLWDNVFTHDISWYERCLWNRMEDFSTLLLGETGTGKGAAAAAIGRSGFIPFNPTTQAFEESFTRAFISINLSQYPEALIESELFGHRKGAFTGAIEKHDGLFARCSPHGAIFLDEIGDVAIPIQIKLLQVLQERTFSPVGSHEKLRFEGRVIAATNKSIDSLRREGKFRDDFYYRLCSDLITVPPLRQRIRETPCELESLVSHLMQRICGPEWSFSPETKSREAGAIATATKRSGVAMVGKLKESVGKNYAWPGNVRELEQAIRRIMLTGTYVGDTVASLANAPAEPGTMTAKELVENYCRELYETYENYGEVARRTGLDWRTVKRHIGES